MPFCLAWYLLYRANLCLQSCLGSALCMSVANLKNIPYTSRTRSVLAHQSHKTNVVSYTSSLIAERSRQNSALRLPVLPLCSLSVSSVCALLISFVRMFLFSCSFYKTDTVHRHALIGNITITRGIDWGKRSH